MPTRSVIGRARRRGARVLDRRFADVIARVEELRGHAVATEELAGHASRSDAAMLDQLAALRAELAELRSAAGTVAELRAEVRSVAGAVAELQRLTAPALRAIVTEEAATRRRLEHLRTQPAYAEPFDDPDPLVSICIPTHDRVDLLTERALPSVLAQTHERVEVIVVGDAAPPRVADAVAAVGDERVRFVNLTQRHATTDAERHWLVGSAGARNTGYALARGHWLVDFDDDDALRPTAIERTLERARRERLEVVYGRLLAHYADGSTRLHGRFPPTVHEFGWHGAVVHAGLRFFGRQYVAAAFDQPNDWFRVETMMRAGVRIGMVDDILCDYYPARSWDHRTPVPESAFIPERAW